MCHWVRRPWTTAPPLPRIPATTRAVSYLFMTIHLCMVDTPTGLPCQYTSVWWLRERSTDQIRVGAARLAHAGERRPRRPQGRPDVRDAERLARQLLLALPGHRGF